VRLDPILSELGLPKDAEKREEVAVSPRDFEKLMGYVAEELGDPSVALDLPAALDWPNYHVVELAARTSPNLRAAFEQVVRYASLIYAYLVFSLEEKDGELRIRHRQRIVDVGGRFGNEYALAATLFYARRYTGIEVTPRRVWFAHREPPNLAELRRFFATRDVDFGRADSGLAFSASDGLRPCVAPDSRLLHTFERLAEAELRERPAPSDFIGQVRAELGRIFLAGAPDASRLARRMKLSTRTLQRRLEERGTTFSAEVDAARRDLACELLRDRSLATAEVAYRLGFSDPAAFTRAFKRWEGMTPSAYRKRISNDSSSG
jgi:AraC-like DNA-binding protein